MPNYLCTVFAVFREQRGNPNYNRLQRVSVRPEEGKLVLAPPSLPKQTAVMQKQTNTKPLTTM